MKEYDYIIIGAGASGLMLASAIGADPHFLDKKILLLDRDQKQLNDRTWCFWEEEEGPFEEIVHKVWDHIYFAGKRYRKQIPIAPYRYKMIRGIDFYQHCLEKLQACNHITFRQEEVNGLKETSEGVEVRTTKGSYKADKVFNSSFDPTAMYSQHRFPVLQQHFIGWFVRAEKDIFAPEMATFMDFSIEQKGNTRFMYVLPFSSREALVEYTLFSESLLKKQEYENAIADYLENDLKCEAYEVVEKEKGRIPMTSYPFTQHNTEKIIHIGISGGWAKASTGYTFRRSILKVEELVQHLKEGKPLSEFDQKTRFWYYDLLLLDILKRDNSQGRRIFESIFKKRSPQLLFKFLDEETNFWEELLTMSGSPALLFLDALRRRIF